MKLSLRVRLLGEILWRFGFVAMMSVFFVDLCIAIARNNALAESACLLRMIFLMVCDISISDRISERL